VRTPPGLALLYPLVIEDNSAVPRVSAGRQAPHVQEQQPGIIMQQLRIHKKRIQFQYITVKYLF